MLSAISATRFAILLAIIAYAEPTPLTGRSPWEETLFALAAGRDAPALFAAAPFVRAAPFVLATPLVRDWLF
jgi:hypothetical protein